MKRENKIPLSNNLLNQYEHYDTNRPIDRPPQKEPPEVPASLLNPGSRYFDALNKRGGRLNVEGLTQLMLKPASMSTKLPSPSQSLSRSKGEDDGQSLLGRSDFFGYYIYIYMYIYICVCVCMCVFYK
jgi:hypothetical protein